LDLFQKMQSGGRMQWHFRLARGPVTTARVLSATSAPLPGRVSLRNAVLPPQRPDADKGRQAEPAIPRNGHPQTSRQIRFARSLHRRLAQSPRLRVSVSPCRRVPPYSRLSLLTNQLRVPSLKAQCERRLQVENRGQSERVDWRLTAEVSYHVATPLRNHQ